MNGMSDFEKWLADEIRGLRKDIGKTREEIQNNRDDVACLDKKLAVQKVKSGLLGTAGGAGVLGIREIIDYIRAWLGGS